MTLPDARAEPPEPWHLPLSEILRSRLTIGYDIHLGKMVLRPLAVENRGDPTAIASEHARSVAIALHQGMPVPADVLTEDALRRREPRGH